MKIHRKMLVFISGYFGIRCFRGQIHHEFHPHEIHHFLLVFRRRWHHEAAATAACRAWCGGSTDLLGGRGERNVGWNVDMMISWKGMMDCDGLWWSTGWWFKKNQTDQHGVNRRQCNCLVQIRTKRDGLLSLLQSIRSLISRRITACTSIHHWYNHPSFHHL